MKYRLYLFLIGLIIPISNVMAYQPSVGLIQNGCPGANPSTLNLNPTDLSEFHCVILGLTKFFIDIAAIFCVFMFVFGGIQYFFSLRHPGGDPSASGHETFYKAGIGLALMIMAHVIMAAVIDAFTKFTPETYGILSQFIG
jgi:hypothetical protein